MMHCSADDVRQVNALVRAVCDQWDDPQRWRETLLIGACRLVGGHVGSISGTTLTSGGAFGQSNALAIFGLPEPLRATIMEAAIKTSCDSTVTDVASTAPGFDVLFGSYAANGWATAARAEIVDDEAHYQSDYHLQYRKAVNCDDYVISVRPVDEPARIEVLMVDRPFGSPRFTPRDVAILTLLHDEIGPLIGVRLSTEEHLSRDGLSRRLRETLNELLAGRSEKEAAARLGVSNTTVHGYVGTLYRHFNVNTRAELMAYFVERQPRRNHDSGEQPSRVCL